MADFDGFKQHILSVLRELDQVQGAIEVLRKNDSDALIERAEMKREIQKVEDKVETVKNSLNDRVTNMYNELGEKIKDNRNLLTWLISGLAAGYGVFKSLGLDTLIGKKLGE